MKGVRAQHSEKRCAGTISPPPPAIEISIPREIIVTFPHRPLFSYDGYCLGVEVKRSLLLLWGLEPPLPGVRVPVHL